MSNQLIFMNTMDGLVNPIDQKKYGGMVNRSWSYTTSNEQDIVICLQAPTQHYLQTHENMQGKKFQNNNYIITQPEKGYNKNKQFVDTLKSTLDQYPVTNKIIKSFMVSPDMEGLAHQLNLEVESSSKSILEGNDKRHIVRTLKESHLHDYIMDGEVLHLSLGFENRCKKVKEYSNNNGITRCKLPESISGNGVHAIDASTNLKQFRDTTLNQGKGGKGFEDNEVILQQHIPNIVGFYNVMTNTSKDGKSKMIGAGITKQKLNGNSHIGNTTDLSVSIEHQQLQVPQHIQEEIKRIAIEVSKLYFQSFQSTGYSGIDFAVSYDSGTWKVWIMEVNDRVNGCYPLHYMVDEQVVSTQGTILETLNLNTTGFTEEEEKRLFPANYLYKKNGGGKQTYIPLSNSGNAYQTLQITQL